MTHLTHLFISLLSVPLARAGSAEVPVSDFNLVGDKGFCDIITVLRTFVVDSIVGFAGIVVLIGAAMWGFSVFSSGVITTAKELLTRIVFGLMMAYGGANLVVAVATLLGATGFLSPDCSSFSFSALNPDLFAPEQAAHLWDNLSQIVTSIIFMIANFVIAVSSLAVTVGGAMYLLGGTSFGDQGRRMVSTALAGLVVASLAKWLVVYLIAAVTP